MPPPVPEPADSGRLARILAWVTRPATLAWTCMVMMASVGVIAGFLGLFVRPTSDDYRLTVWARAGGPVETLDVFYNQVSGRVGSALITGVVYMSPTGARLTALVTFVAMATIVAFLCHSLARSAGLRVPMVAALTTGFGVAAITLLDQPRAYHTLYWTTAVITHTLPPLVVTALVALALRVGSIRGRRILCVATVAAGVLVGSITEPLTFVSIVLAGLCVLTHLMFIRRVTFALVFTGSLLAGMAIGALIVLTSPGHDATREARTHGEKLFDAKVLSDAVDGWVRTLHHFATNDSLLAAVGVGILLSAFGGGPTAWRWSRAAALWAVVMPVIAVVASALPVLWSLRVGWGPMGWTFFRGWLVLSYLTVLCLVWYGFLAGIAVRRLAAKKAVAEAFPKVLTVGACLVILLAGVTYVDMLYKLGGRMANRATAWDAQDARIKRARARGETVVAICQLPMARLGVAFNLPRPKDWMAQSIAQYYRIAEVVPAPRKSCR